MVDENPSTGVADIEQRMVTLVYPLTFEEFRQYFDQGYQCATTREQRIEWSLEPVDDLRVLSQEEALRVLFAEPGDPILDEFDDECSPDPNWELTEANAPDADAMGRIAAAERRVETTITVRDSRREADGAGDGGDAEAPQDAAAPA